MTKRKIDFYKNHLDEKIENIKEMMKPVDAQPIIEFLLRANGEMSDEAKEEMSKLLKKIFTNAGNIFLDRALSDGTMSEDELKEWVSLGITHSDFATILLAYYNKKDGHVKSDEKQILVTTEDSGTYINRTKVKEKFGIDVKSSAEIIREMPRNEES